MLFKKKKKELPFPTLSEKENKGIQQLLDLSTPPGKRSPRIFPKHAWDTIPGGAFAYFFFIGLFIYLIVFRCTHH